jgi:hypothetical protein
MEKADIISAVRGLDHETLKTLLPIVQAELDRKNPENIERDRRMNAFWAEQKRKNDARESERAALVGVFKAKLVPGMLLKMRGCRDGGGLREFIKWDGDKVVCWQVVSRRWWKATGRGDSGSYVTTFENTHQATTHMVDKIAGVYITGTRTLVKTAQIVAGSS